MSHTFSRQELFDLVWSEPTRTIAKGPGISDVGLAKACRRADLLFATSWALGETRSRPKSKQTATAAPNSGDVRPNRLGSGPLELGTRSSRPLDA